MKPRHVHSAAPACRFAPAAVSAVIDPQRFIPAVLRPGTLVHYCAEFSGVPAGVWRVVGLCRCGRCQGALRQAEADRTSVQPRYLLELPWGRARLRDVGHDTLTVFAGEVDLAQLIQNELDAYWQHASPTGGFITTEHRHAITFRVGQVIERACRWLLVTGANPTSPTSGLTIVTTADDGIHRFWANEGARVRTDVPDLNGRPETVALGPQPDPPCGPYPQAGSR